MKNLYETDYKVIVSDINYGGHMGNERALIIFQQTRMEWLNSIGYDEANIEGKGLIQLESHVYYLKEVFLGETLLCRIVNVQPERITFNIEYEILNKNNDIVIKGMTKMAVFDYEKKKIARIPKEFLEKLEK
ncbi:acyl-CoA thioesterase [Fusobacterium perfoetens]|uniref:acyl-CoA thioesterase n=1 Tax=Fusobacterium perfoetens TaxID=852 RepID=UPI001F4365ED|nr:thioesterase family protein [Fusobacterium perfoetens]MCF2625134.1 acyl-CoA thioesterase [Fusobacterium perfoetens]